MFGNKKRLIETQLNQDLIFNQMMKLIQVVQCHYNTVIDEKINQILADQGLDLPTNPPESARPTIAQFQGDDES